MNASFILLNHFSQRYGRVPPIDEFKPNVAASFDFMTVNVFFSFRVLTFIPKMFIRDTAGLSPLIFVSKNTLLLQFGNIEGC